MKWKIGNVKINNQIVLAPMAGICDSAFRIIIKSMGCGLVCTEMVSDKAVIHSNKLTHEMLYMTDYERPISQQIFGNSSETLEKASEHIINYIKPDILDGDFEDHVRNGFILGKEIGEDNTMQLILPIAAVINEKYFVNEV